VVPRRRSSRLLFALVTLALAVGLVLATRNQWLTAIGRALIEDQGPQKAEVAVLLAGDQSGIRLRRAAEIARQGYVSSVLVSGPRIFYGVAESDLAIAWAAREGYPPQWFIPAANYCRSTAEEARFVYDELERRRIGSFLLVTSDFHTGRAARIFRAEGRARGSAIRMRVVAAYDQAIGAGNWWHSREGMKRIFFEGVKSVTSRFGL
jgi:uncharacterized SAM-binding protein YcdF (DUF218 family)